MSEEEDGVEWEAGWRGCPDPRSQPWPDSEGGGGGEEGRKRETGYKYNSTAAHSKFYLNLGDLG